MLHISAAFIPLPSVCVLGWFCSILVGDLTFIFPHLPGEGLQILSELLSPPRPCPSPREISVGTAGPQPDARGNVRENARKNVRMNA